MEILSSNETAMERGIKMKFSIGYQLPDEYDSITSIATDYVEHIEEVYFAWPGAASGRTPLGILEQNNMEYVKGILEEELRTLKNLGIKLVLLYNSNCYGDKSISIAFQNEIKGLVGYLDSRFGLDTITTTSPFVAKVVKETFPHIEIRASVNMRVGTVKGMDYLSEHFDGFYMQREFNRDFKRIKTLHEWCSKHNKKLHLLANSGCLNFCSNQTYHDNLVAHESEIVKNENVDLKNPSPCWDYMEKKENWVSFLQNSWIRPEDIEQYASYFNTVKLATRMHSNPRKVLAAYVRQKFKGNMLDLTEPGYSKIFGDYIIDNTLFPEDWFEVTSGCNKDCESCNYCSETLGKVLVDINDLNAVYVQ